jgi:ribosomal protein S18 acetylase RimI-like enzyme
VNNPEVRSEVTVRFANRADDAALSTIDVATWNDQVSPAPPPADPDTYSFLDRRDPADVLVAERDRQVAGHLTLRGGGQLPSHEHVLEIVGVAVAPQHQGHGVGRALVEAALVEARRREARKVSLRVLGPNGSARRLYERCGFRVEGVLHEEFLLDGRYVDDVVMAVHLTNSAPDL